MRGLWAAVKKNGAKPTREQWGGERVEQGSLALRELVRERREHHFVARERACAWTRYLGSLTVEARNALEGRSDILRWTAAGILEAERHFREIRLNQHSISVLPTRRASRLDPAEVLKAD